MFKNAIKKTYQKLFLLNVFIIMLFKISHLVTTICMHVPLHMESQILNSCQQTYVINLKTTEKRFQKNESITFTGFAIQPNPSSVTGTSVSANVHCIVGTGTMCAAWIRVTDVCSHTIRTTLLNAFMLFLQNILMSYKYGNSSFYVLLQM